MLGGNISVISEHALGDNVSFISEHALGGNVSAISEHVMGDVLRRICFCYIRSCVGR